MIVFRDGCDSYSATADILSKWDGNTGWVYNATAGRNGGGGLQSVTGTGILKSRFGVLAANDHCIAFWFKASTTPAATVDFIGCYSSADSIINKIRINSTGTVSLTNSVNTLIVTAGTRNICDNAWHWLEFRIKHVSGGVGGMQVYIDTTIDVNSFTGSAGVGTIDHLGFNGLVAATVAIDDVMIWDDVAGGPQLASMPLGPRQITTWRPSADSVQTFSRSAGSDNYALVDEQAYNSNTDYVESGTSGDQDLYEYENFSVQPATITEMCLNSVLINPNPGTINFQSACKSVGTTTLGASTNAPSVYSTKQTSYPVDPATSAAWLAAAADAAKFGIKVV